MDYDISKGNEFVYLAGFELKDQEIIKDYKEEKNLDKYTPTFIACVFPYIRESLVSITKDTGITIELPIVDCRMISFENSLVLTINE